MFVCRTPYYKYVVTTEQPFMCCNWQRGYKVLELGTASNVRIIFIIAVHFFPVRPYF